MNPGLIDFEEMNDQSNQLKEQENHPERKRLRGVLSENDEERNHQSNTNKMNKVENG